MNDRKPTMKFAEFAELVHEITTKCPPEIRRGQHAFNTLWSMQPEIANRVRATGFDPFHQNENIPDFLAWLLLKHVTMD